MAGEMTQTLRALLVLPEDMGSIPSNHVAANNHLLLHFQGTYWLLLTSVGTRYVPNINIQ